MGLHKDAEGDPNYMGRKGLWTGFCDKEGNKVHIGDEVNFDGNEWNRTSINMSVMFGEPVDQTLFDPVQITVTFHPSEGLSPAAYDIEKYCTLVTFAKEKLGAA